MTFTLKVFITVSMKNQKFIRPFFSLINSILIFKYSLWLVFYMKIMESRRLRSFCRCLKRSFYKKMFSKRLRPIKTSHLMRRLIKHETIYRFALVSLPIVKERCSKSQLTCDLIFWWSQSIIISTELPQNEFQKNHLAFIILPFWKFSNWLWFKHQQTEDVYRNN